MDFLTLAKRRCAIRRYTNQPVEPEKLEKLLLAAQAAPTAANLQPVRLIAVQTPEGLAKLGKAANVYGAPLAVIVCADHSKAWTRPFDKKQSCDIDASILTDHMMLEAADLGLGSVWICYFKPDVLRTEFRLPDELEPINVLAIGYAGEPAASEERHSQLRIPVSELVSFQ